MGKPGLRHMARFLTAPGLMRAHRIANASKGAIGAIPAIANSPATPNARPPRAVLPPIAGSIPTTRTTASGAATIDPDTERQRCARAAFPLLLHMNSCAQHAPAFSASIVAIVVRTETAANGVAGLKGRPGSGRSKRVDQGRCRPRRADAPFPCTDLV